jgi:ABC-type multidrug transport system fused ATPase/permease subunit
MSAMDGIQDRKTVLIIAHRLTTVRQCDRIVVMEQGHVVGFDTWDNLIADCPAFQRIANNTQV